MGGIHEPDEGCDDGNRVGGDGCSSNCAIEPDWYCKPHSTGNGKDVCARVQDCEVGEWGEWVTCNAECGGGLQSHERQIIKPASPGGASCAALEESRECNTAPCPAVNCTMS